MGLQSVGCGWRAASVVGWARPPACLSTGVPGLLRPTPPPSPLPAFPGQVLAEAELPQHVGGCEGWGQSPLLAAFLPECLPPSPQSRPACLMGPDGYSLKCMCTQPTSGRDLKCPWRHSACLDMDAAPLHTRPSGECCSRCHCLSSLVQSPPLPPASGQRVWGSRLPKGPGDASWSWEW